MALGIGAALENVVPPVPADTFVFLGAFLAARGPTETTLVFAVTWAANAAGALLVYGAGYRYGPPFFDGRIGRMLLGPEQLARVERFYRRRGVAAIFFARFLPGLRAVVPAFAGVARLSFASVALPVTVASALWYGGLVWLGARAGENLEAAADRLATANRLLLAVAVAVALLVLAGWLRTRPGARRGDGRGPEGR